MGIFGELFGFDTRAELFPTWNEVTETLRGLEPGRPVNIVVEGYPYHSSTDGYNPTLECLPGSEKYVRLIFSSANSPLESDTIVGIAEEIASSFGDIPARICFLTPEDRTHNKFSDLSNGYSIWLDPDVPNLVHIEGEVVYDKNMTTYMG